ncbi:MAG TPA: hypothetical protein VF319_15770 [Caldimonas sp.]
MSEPVAINNDDPRFAEAVGAVLEARLPHLVSAERYLSKTVLIFSLLSTLGVLVIAMWAARIVWQKDQEEYIKATVQKLEEDSTGPVGHLTADFTNMSKTLSATFETQVDSATFKALRFGCTPPSVPATTGFPVCSNTNARAGLFQALDDQTILLVANPSTQIVRLDISLYPVDKIDKLEPLFLQIYAEPPPMHATPNSVRALLALKPEQLGANGGELLQDGRLRLVSPSSGPMQAAIDLTPSLRERALSGPMQLRFAAVREQQAPAAAASSSASKGYEPATGTELFFVRTITSAYHRIPAVKR